MATALAPHLRPMGGDSLVTPSDAALFLAAAGISDATIVAAINQLVTDLKAAGLWTKCHAIYPFVGGTAFTHKWNLKDPRDLDAAFRLTFTGGTHSNALGYRPNAAGTHAGSSGKADTYFIPRDHLAAHSTHLAYYSTEDTTPSGQTEMGNFSWSDGPGHRHHIIARYSGTTFYWGMSESGASNVSSVSTATGLLVSTRTGATAQACYRNGVNLDSNSVPGTPHPNNSVWIGGINSFTDKTDRPCAFASMGAGLDATDNANLYAAVQAFQTTLGRQV